MTTGEPFNRLKACRHGQMLYNINDQYIGRSLDVYGEFSEGEISLFLQFVRPGSVVIEVGANIGTHTVPLAQQVEDTGAVLAFEPQRVVFQTLAANVALNSLSNVYLLQQAVGAQTGSVWVPSLNFRLPNNFGGLALGTYEQGERVAVVAIDDIDLPRCDFVKVDVEGMEQQVLEGARRTITKFHPILYVENDRPDKSADLVRLVDSFGYQMYWHMPPLFNPQNFFGNPENVFEGIVSINMLCIHRDRSHDLKGFDRVEVPKG